MITSKPFNSTLYGAIMGALVLSLFKSETKKTVLSEDDKKEL
jgi:hypothetical protein